MATINAQCPACKQPLAVVVGRKSTSRRATCRCGTAYDYSCWITKVMPGRTFHQIDLFPAATK